MNATLATPYVDGWYGPERELTVVPRPQFPFKTSPIPDVYTRLYEREYKVYPRGYVPKIANRTAWTNLLTYSEQFENAAWTKGAATVTPATGTAPDGQATLGTVFETATTAEHSVSQAVVVPAAPVEFSVFASSVVGRSWIRLTFTDSAAAVSTAFFDISSGRTGPRSAGTTATIVSLGGGHFRCVLRLTPAAGAGTFKINLSSDGAAVSYAGNAALGVRLWGAQATAGTGAPYVSTTAATRTSNAPDHDKADPLAYLIEEQDPATESSEAEIIRRAFCRVPRQQVVPSSMFITKPPLAGTFPQVIGSSLVLQPDPTVPNYVFYSRHPVTNDTGPPATVSYPTGGTYTLTVGTETTAAIAYNASAATVQAALLALPILAARGSVVVTGSYNPGPGSVVGLRLAFDDYFDGPYDTVSPDITLLTNTAGVECTRYNVIEAEIYTPFYGWKAHVWVGTSAPGATLNGGTYTLTFFGQTTAPIAWNASLATIQAALQALSHLGTGIVCEILTAYGYTAPLAADHTGVEFYILIPFAAVSVDGSALTPAGSTAIFNPGVGTWKDLNFSGVNTTFRQIDAPGHGLANGDTILVTNAGSDNITLVPGQFSVLSPSTIRFPIGAGSVYGDAQAITFVGKRSETASYTGGTKLTRTKRVTDFYLPGVTPGIATADDIPLPVYQGDAPSLLAAIFAGATSINYEVGELVQWRGPILARTITTLNAAAL